MARKLRIQFPDALYLITNRGDRHQAIALDDEDRSSFFHTLEEAVHKTQWQIQALCLLPNHFHMLLRTPRENLVEGMKWFLATYTGRFNRRHRTPGHLFAGRYKSQLLDPTDTDLIVRAIDYIHLNPIRLPENPVSISSLDSHLWSSYPDYLEKPSTTPRSRPWLAIPEGLTRMGLDQALDAPDQIRNRTTAAAQLPWSDPAWMTFRRGWCVGGVPYRQFLLEQLNLQRDDRVSGAAWQEAAALAAEQRVKQLLAQSGWTEAMLITQPKSHPEKIRIAQKLREETTMTLDWIAARLSMGSTYTLRNVLAVHRAQLRAGTEIETQKLSLSSTPVPQPAGSAKKRVVRDITPSSGPFREEKQKLPRIRPENQPPVPTPPPPPPPVISENPGSFQFEPGWD